MPNTPVEEPTVEEPINTEAEELAAAMDALEAWAVKYGLKPASTD